MSDSINPQDEKNPSILTRTWRYIPFKKYDSYLKIALNEVALASVNTSGTPIVWLAGYEKNCISIGQQQHLAEVVNLSEAKRRDIVLVRRQTRGGALYLDKDGELSWAIILPNELLPKDAPDIPKFFAQRLSQALENLGIESYFKSPDDVMTTLGKISNMEIRRERYATYAGGTLIFTVNVEAVRTLLKPENDSTKEKHKSPEKFRPLTAISMETEHTKEETLQAVAEEFLNGITFKVDSWSSQELSDAQMLAQKYAGKEWLYQDNK